MKLPIPFHASLKDTECAQRCLQMIAEYCGKKKDLEGLSLLTQQLPSGMTWTLGIVRAAKKLNFNVRILSIGNFSHEKDNIAFYQKEAGNSGLEVLKRLQRETNRMGIKIENRDVKLSEIEHMINDKKGSLFYLIGAS